MFTYALRLSERFSSLRLLDVVLGAAGLYMLKRLLSARASAPLPPGPRRLPLLGNALDFPAKYEWLTFSEWGKTWGKICSVSVFGQLFIILNDAQIAFDMLDKKSTIHSDRPVLQMGGELCGWKDTLVLLQYDDRFRRFRKMFHRLIGSPSLVKRFAAIEEEETHKFLQRVVKNPEGLPAHVRHTAGAIILKLSHGYDVKDHDDPLVDLADRAVEQFCISTAPGGFTVDLVPALKYVPSWFPGAVFKRTAKFYKETLQEMVDKPYNWVKDQMAAGIAPLSFTSALLEDSDLTDEKVHDIKWASASLYSGGADTTVSAIYSLFLAMTLYPEVQRQAQEEIDRVIGNERLPSFADRDNLPYLNALAKEVLRWNSVTPIGVPHRSSEDDICEGYFIPENSIIIVNIWGLLNDPRTYPDPRKFDPERYLGNSPQLDPREICFGFGRRVCPGQHLADASVFISCAMSLAVFNMTKVIENGVMIEPKVENTTGTISHPVPYRCSVKPRSQRALALILSEADV